MAESVSPDEVTRRKLKDLVKGAIRLTDEALMELANAQGSTPYATGAGDFARMHAAMSSALVSRALEEIFAHRVLDSLLSYGSPRGEPSGE